MIMGAHDPEWIADGLSEEAKRALTKLRANADLYRPVAGWRDALMVLRPNGPPVLTPIGKRVRETLLRRINASGMEARRAIDAEGGVVHDSPVPKGDAQGPSQEPSTHSFRQAER